jgi:hypothetical protein
LKRAVRWHGLALAGCFLVVLGIGSITARAQTTPEQYLAADSGEPDFVKPPPNLFQMTDSYRTTPGTPRDVSTETLNLRYDHAFNLQSGWVFVTRFDLPLVAKNAITDSNPNGDFMAGVGNAKVQGSFFHDIDERLAFGFGLRVVTPTGDDELASNRWQAMPIVGLRLALPEISSGSYFEPLLRYGIGFGSDIMRRNISDLQFAPTLNIHLPDKWYVALFPSPDIRINLGDPITGQTGRWFVPFDVRVGKKLTESIALSLEVGVPIIKDYPVYNLKTQVRLNVTY